MKSFFVALGVLVALVCVLSTKYHMGERAQFGKTVAPSEAKKARFAWIDGEWVDTEKNAPVKGLPPEAKVEPTTKLTSTGDNKFPVWQVVSKWETTKQDAEQSALIAGQSELINYIRTQEPPLEWTPSLDFVRGLRKVTKEESHNFGPSVGQMHQATLEIKVTPQARKEMWQHDKELRAQTRMLWLARVLAALVVLLGAVAAYFRMEEMTKGYYTGWLRLAAASFVGAAAVGLFLLG